MSPKVLYFFHTVQNFGNFSLKDPKSAGIWEIGTHMPPMFMAFVTARPPILCLACTCLRGMLLPQTRSAEAGKFCILETESWNLVNTFRCKINQGDENKILVLQVQPTQLYIMDELHWRAGLIHRPSSLALVKYRRGYILKPPSVWLCATWLSTQMPSVPEAAGPGKFWNTDPIWGYILLILATNCAF